MIAFNFLVNAKEMYNTEQKNFTKISIKDTAIMIARELELEAYLNNFKKSYLIQNKA